MCTYVIIMVRYTSYLGGGVSLHPSESRTECIIRTERIDQLHFRESVSG